MLTARLLHALGIPGFAVFTVALHLWSGLLAFAFVGWIAAGLTLFVPVLSLAGVVRLPLARDRDAFERLHRRRGAVGRVRSADTGSVAGEGFTAPGSIAMNSR